MRAEIIAIGSELLQFGRRDTNGDWLSLQLARLGLVVGRRTMAGDDASEIADAIGAARRRSRLVVVTGGLGPTADDLTREGLAACLGRKLRVDPQIRDALLARISSRGYRVLGSAESQARLPEGCEPIGNPVGSAPGIVDDDPMCFTLVLPGVPGEMKPMFEAALPRLRERLRLEPAPFSRMLVAGLPESEVDDLLKGLIGISDSAHVTILASEGGVELLISGTGEDAGRASREVARITEEIRARLGACLSAEGEESLAASVGRRLTSARASLAVAESCTGGLLGGTITAVPGASAWFVGGFLVYSDEMKRQLLGVDSAQIARHGAVSEPVARAMAEGARDRTSASYGVAITGIAGPDGGTVDKPVGLVFVALAGPGETRAERLRLSGDRQNIRARAVTRALEMLRTALPEPER